MRLKIIDTEDGVLLLDRFGKSIVNVRSTQGDDGNFVTAPVFREEVAQEIVLALELLEILRRCAPPPKAL